MTSVLHVHSRPCAPLSTSALEVVLLLMLLVSSIQLSYGIASPRAMLETKAIHLGESTDPIESSADLVQTAAEDPFRPDPEAPAGRLKRFRSSPRVTSLPARPAIHRSAPDCEVRARPPEPERLEGRPR